MVRAENRRLRREALQRIRSDSGEAARSLVRNWRRRGDLASDRALRFPDRTWDELEALPQPLRNAAHRAIFHLLEEQAPQLAGPFPDSDPLPGAYRLYLLSSVGRVDHLVTRSRKARASAAVP